MSHCNGSKPATKVVVRFLPSNLSEKVFFENISQYFKDGILWYRFVAGKRRKTIKKPSTNSRVYMNFPTNQLAMEFIETFHGAAFVDEKGEIYKAVVCFAPYPQVPRSSIPVDKKKNTMETDPVYIAFLESLDKKPSKPSVQEPVDGTQTNMISPLVLEVSQRRKKNLAQQKQGREKKKNKLIKIQLKENAPQDLKIVSPASIGDPPSRQGKPEAQNVASKNKKAVGKIRRRERKERSRRPESASQPTPLKAIKTIKQATNKLNTNVEKQSEWCSREAFSNDLNKAQSSSITTKRAPVILLKKAPSGESKKNSIPKIALTIEHPLYTQQQEGIKSNLGLRNSRQHSRISGSLEKINDSRHMVFENSKSRSKFSQRRACKETS